MEPLHLIIVVPLAAWLGARIGRKVPWSSKRGGLPLSVLSRRWRSVSACRRWRS